MMLQYFGTNTRSPGHYFWDCYHLHGLHSSNMSFRDIPFNPEEMPRRIGKESIALGESRFYCENGYSILAIEGSPADKRSGSKSVFFVKEIVTEIELIKAIMNNEAAKAIIDKMPFSVGIRNHNKMSFK